MTEQPIRPCPNRPGCPHHAGVHDVWDLDDDWPTCCVEGCRCGHPGTAVLQRSDDGKVAVVRADPVVRVARELAREFGLHPDKEWVLDSWGDYRYRFLRDIGGGDGIIYGRIWPDQERA
jgi:hypothetical protein